MNGNKKAVLDSNILIYLSKKQLDFNSLASKYQEIYISVISYMETLGFNFADVREEVLLKSFLQQFAIVQTDMNIANQVVAYRKIRKVKTPDAVILATTKSLGAELVTINVGDFKGLDNSVSVFTPALIAP